MIEVFECSECESTNVSVLWEEEVQPGNINRGLLCNDCNRDWFCASFLVPPMEDTELIGGE